MGSIGQMPGSGGIYPQDPISGPGGAQPPKEQINISKMFAQFHDLLARLGDSPNTQKLLYIGAEIDKLKEQITNISDQNPIKKGLEELTDQFAKLTEVSIDLNKLQERFKPNVEMSEEFAEQIAGLQNQKAELLDSIQTRLQTPEKWR